MNYKIFTITLPLESKVNTICIQYRWYRKFTKYFLNLEKQKAVNGNVEKIIIKDDVEITDQLKIQHEFRMFYEKLL